MSERFRVAQRVASLGSGDRLRLIKRMGLPIPSMFPPHVEIGLIADAVVASGRTADFFVHADAVEK